MKKIISLLSTFTLVISLFYCSTTSAEGPKNYLKGKFYNTVKNHFLIASKKMNDDKFKKSVIVMLESDKDGAFGLVINKPLGTVPMAVLLDPANNSYEEREKLYDIKMPIFWGGPVDSTQIFILHSKEYKSKTTKNYGDISISQDYKILLDVAKKKGPKNILIILGYSGWGSGQLEGEMERDHWLLSEIDLNLIFKIESKKKWKKAYKKSFLKI